MSNLAGLLTYPRDGGLPNLLVSGKESNSITGITAAGTVVESPYNLESRHSLFRFALKIEANAP